MFEKTLANVIAIDTDGETIHFYSADPKTLKNIRYDSQTYHARLFDDEFFEKLGHILKLHREKNPNEPLQSVSLVLPDQAFLMDTVNIPTIQKNAMQNSLEVAIRNIYKNADALSYNTFAAAQNKQFTTYSLVGIRKELISKFKHVCSDNQISVSNITFSANTAANAAFVLNSKLKNASFILLDIKDKTARFSVIVKGRTVAYYALPFGYNILSKSRVAAEDLLFNHAPAELIVLNAKEKAKAKQLTVGEEIAAMDQIDETLEEETLEESEAAEEPTEEEIEIKYSAALSKKSARKLPKFMLRDTPETKEGYAFENFRIFLKWTLDLYSNNATLMNLGSVDTVYVNMPESNSFLYDMVNAEAEENKLKFIPLVSSNDQDIVTDNLELFGGFYVKQYNKTNNF